VREKQSVILFEGSHVTKSGASIPEIKRFEVVDEQKVQVHCIHQGNEISYFLEGDEINSPSGNLVTKPDIFGLFRKYTLDQCNEKPLDMLP
jgi:hypothetical protein